MIKPLHAARLALACTALAAICPPPALAATSLRGMETGEDFRIGPVFQAGLPLLIPEPGDRQYYSLSLQGESPNHGYSRFFLRVISLYELLDLPRLNDPNGAIDRQLRFHHQFATLGLESPLFYELISPSNFELGWSLALSLARVTFKDPDKPQAEGFASVFSDYKEIKPSDLGAQIKTNQAQADAQFLGTELGGYARYYGLYPLVPYARAGINLGSYFNSRSMFQGVEPATRRDNDGLPQPVSSNRQRVYESGLSFSPVASLGLDFYIASRGLIGAELSFWNWDILNRPQDSSLFFSLRAGFLF